MKGRLMPLRLLSLTGVLGFAACSMGPPPVAMSNKSAVEMRAMETRIYPLTDRGLAMRDVISTLQDLGYNMDKVRSSTGTITAVKLSVLRVSVAVTPHPNGQMAIRANAEVQVGNQFHQIDAPEFYETDFFAPLSSAIPVAATPESASSPDSIPVPMPDSLYSQPSS